MSLTGADGSAGAVGVLVERTVFGVASDKRSEGLMGEEGFTHMMAVPV